jgi:hypothetical protein
VVPGLGIRADSGVVVARLGEAFPRSRSGTLHLPQVGLTRCRLWDPVGGVSSLPSRPGQNGPLLRFRGGCEVGGRS